MFGFIKKLKTVYEVYEPLSVRERALKIFSRIEGLDDIKEMMLRALESPERVHTLLVGPPAYAKSLFMLEIEKFLATKVYFAEGASTTKAGIQRFVVENQHKEILIIDEIDKMSIKDQEGLLTMMERAAFTSTTLNSFMILNNKNYSLGMPTVISYPLRNDSEYSERRLSYIRQPS